MAERRREDKGLLDKSLELLKDFSDRVQREANRSWKISGLKAERDGLRREVSEAERALGIEVQRRIRAGESLIGGLDRHSEKIERLDTRLRSLDRDIASLEAAELRRPSAAADKPRKSSLSVGTTQRPPAPGLTLATAAPEIDPLRDILGEAADLAEIEDGQ